MKKRLAIIAALVLAGLIGGGIAYASIPGPDGVIHGCYKTSDGRALIIDSADTCPNGYTALNWNQTGVQGPQGVPGPAAGWEMVQEDAGTSGGQVAVSPDCPTGKFAVSGGWHFTDDLSGNTGATQVIHDGPETTAPTLSQAWIVRIIVTNGGTLRGWAVCATRP
jgi:hypothetical protein